MSVRITADRVRTAQGIAGNTIVVDAGRVRWVGVGEPGPSHLTGTVVPGLRDAHLHPALYAATIAGPDLREIEDLGTLRDVLSTEAGDLRPGAVLVARGFDDERMGGRLPTARDLDAVADYRPILLYRRCGHLAVANSAALAAGNVGRATPDPPGGSIERDDHGEPTGVLRETAIDIVARSLAPSVDTVRPRDLRRALDDLAERGHSEIHAMVAPDSSMWCGPKDEMRLLAEIDLPLRVRAFAITDDPDVLARVSERAQGELSFGGWKGFADGALGARTAALSSPYADTGGTGTARWDVGAHRACAEQALELGGEVAIHAIGDLAVDRVLDLFGILVRGGAPPSSLRIEHASVIRPDSIERMAAMGVTGSIQPAFVRSDGAWIPDRLGRDRIAWAHPFRSMAKAGIRLLGGSDAPVEIPDPWQAIADARSRPFLPADEALDAEAAFSLYVPSDALTPGAPADFLVLDGDPVDGTEDVSVLARYRRGARVG